MKRVLVVDDEADMLWMLQRNLNKGMEDIEVLGAKSGEEALAILSDKKVNLVITDINMPGMNGLDLLVEINNRYPNTGVIIMTAYPSNAYESQAMLSGSLRFIEKPFDINDVRQIVKETLSSEEGFQGTVDGIELMDIVQFNGLSRATAALKVTTATNEGMIFFKDGEVVHAMCNNENGESAFFKLLTFQGGSLQNIRGVQPPVMSITKNLDSLLLEAASRSDEEDVPAQVTEQTLPETTITEPDFSFLDTEDGVDQVDDNILFEPDQDLEPSTSFDDGFPASAAPLPDIEKPEPFEELEAINDEPLPISPELTEEKLLVESNEELPMSSVQQILAEFTNIEGVHTACLVGRDGFLLDSLARPDIDAEMIGAIASSGFGSAESMGKQLGQEELTMTMFEYESGPVMFAPVGTEAFLVIVADKGTNLGWIRIAIKKNSQKIAEAADL